METHGVAVHSIRALRGPNLYAYKPVLQIRMDIGPYEERPSSSFPGFTERLGAWLPGLAGHECSVGRPGGFLERLRRGTYLAHILEHITLELQNLMGFDVAFGRARGAGQTGIYDVVIAYKEEAPARAAFETALRLTLSAIHDEPFQAAEELERLVDLADKYRLDPSTQAIVEAACARSIPVLRLVETGSLVQLGYGVHQKRIRASETSNTSQIAVEICQDKSMTSWMLRRVGVPVPDSQVVGSAEEAWSAAQHIGLPMVVKPRAGNQVQGVRVGLRTEAEVHAAYDSVKKHGSEVLVERCIEGRDYRLLVVNGRMVAAAWRESAQVKGDGGTSTDVTDAVHPSNIRLGELAAQILALDVAGLDVLCQDIGRPLREQGGAIVEVNAAPELRMHLRPTHGQPRDVGGPIVEMLYSKGAPSRIPILAVTGTNGKTTVTRLLGHMYETAHFEVGMTCTDGTYIGRERILSGDCSGPQSATSVLLHPRVEVAVLETARGGILSEGLAFDRCTVGVVLNVSADYLGLDGIETVAELARVQQVVIESIDRDGAAILNAEDSLVAEMAAATDARVVYFSQASNSPVLRAHLMAGGTGVFVESGAIVVASSEQRLELVKLARIPFTSGGAIRFQVQNALAATAAAWAAGLNPALIVRALATFRSSADMAPGHFNVSEVAGVQIVVDYGHNAAAMRALGEAVRALGWRRTVMVLGLPGDRRNSDLLETLAATTSFVDEYVLHDSASRRGRAQNEIPELLRKSLPLDRTHAIAPTQKEAIRYAWSRLRSGERLLIMVDELDSLTAALQELSKDGAGAEDGACTASLRPEPEAADRSTA